MNTTLTLLTLVATLVGELTKSSSIQSVITSLQQIVTAGVQEVSDVAPMIKNIIGALKSNAAITADQMAQLEALDAATDAAFEAAAKDAGLGT